MTEAIEKVKGIINGLLEKMGVEAELEVREQTETTVFNIQTRDSHMLIGKHGVNLYALQYLCRILARRSLADSFDFVIDVDDYKKKRESFLQNLAEEARALAVNKNKAVILKIMPAYERRIIHSHLAGDEQITTDSVGEEPERMVVVRPAALTVEVDPAALRFGEEEDYKVID